MRQMIRCLFGFLMMLAALTSTASSAGEPQRYQEFRQETYKIQQAYLTQLTRHHVQMMRDMEVKLAQQEWQTTAISIMVMVMVGFGLVLSALQFYADWRRPAKAPISVKLGIGSVELNSSVIGIVILGLSFWFFQTYVNHVYDIKAIPLNPIDATQYGLSEPIRINPSVESAMEAQLNSPATKID